MPDEMELRTAYQQYRDPLFRFAYRLSGSAATAEDLVHDAFVGLFRGGFDPSRGTLQTYLYSAVRNLARKHFRDLGREDLEEEVETPLDDSPLDRLLAREIAQEVQGAIALLPLLQREVLVLAEYEELPLDEIARIVDADLGAVKSRLHRARFRLRKVLLSTMKGSV